MESSELDNPEEWFSGNYPSGFDGEPQNAFVMHHGVQIAQPESRSPHCGGVARAGCFQSAPSAAGLRSPLRAGFPTRRRCHVCLQPHGKLRWPGDSHDTRKAAASALGSDRSSSPAHRACHTCLSFAMKSLLDTFRFGHILGRVYRVTPARFCLLVSDYGFDSHL